MRSKQNQFLNLKAPLLVVGGLIMVSGAAQAATRSVGPGKSYSTPCQAIAAAADGDVIEIDASGSYNGDVCAIPKNNLTLRGVGGRAVLNAAGRNAQDKATWVISGSNTTIENIEFTGATSSARNGAGIRQEGANLTVRNSVFRDNQNGILANDNSGSTITIEGTEFGNNGSGDGYTHNIYVNKIKKFVFRSNYSHDSKGGHLVKSRAAENHILYNRLDNKGTGGSSYEVDMPNGGLSYVIGNIIHQGASPGNPHLVAYAYEGAVHPSKNLYVVNNTMINDRTSGGVFVGARVDVPALVANNAFVGAGTSCEQSGCSQKNNKVATVSDFNNLGTLDVRPRPSSVLINGGTDPGASTSGLSLKPTNQYVHPAKTQARPAAGALDIGAYEDVTSAPATTPTPTPTPAPSPSPTPAAGSAQISRIDLVNAATDTTIKTIVTGETINLKNYGASQVSIRVYTSPAEVQKVVFNLNGTDVRTEQWAPYLLAGDSSTSTKVDYLPWTYTLGTTYTLVVSPYVNNVKGQARTVQFKLINQ